MNNLGSAFLGALCAFVFMVLWDAVVRHRERWIRHYSGLVQLGRELNDQIAMIHNATMEIDYIIKAGVSAKIEPYTLPRSVNQPEEIPISSTRELDIVNLDLANDHATYRYNILCINRDIRRLTGTKREMESALAEKRYSAEEYLAHFEFLSQMCRHLMGHLMAAEEDAITLTAKTRVRMRCDRPWFHAVSMWMRRTRYESNFTDITAVERRVLMQEIETVAARSGERIQDIQKGCYGEKPNQCLQSMVEPVTSLTDASAAPVTPTIEA